MRIALGQLWLHGGARSANLRRVCEMVDQACAVDPPPDLVLLPEACDTGRLRSRVSDLTAAMADVFAGCLAMKAREWGVYVAVGFHRADGGGARSAATVFDPDGDAALRFPGPDAGARDAEPRRTLPLLLTPWGTWGLRVGSHDRERDGVRALVAAGARVILVPACQSVDEDDGSSRWAGAASAHHAYICVAIGLSAVPGPPRRDALLSCGSRVFGPDGQCLTDGSARAEGILYADLRLDLEPSLP